MSSGVRMSMLAVCAVLLLLTAGQAEARRRRPKVAEVDSKDAGATADSRFKKVRANETDSARKGKVFSLFSIVQFENGACQSDSSNTGSGNRRNGTCYTASECDDKNGQAEGNCAAGFGVCCLFLLNDSDDTDVSENCTYVQNPGYPTGQTASTAITYNVDKCSNDVCFIRLDFETFTIQGTGGTDVDDEGVCLDTFAVTASATNQNIPVICGDNTGQHMYIDIGRSDGDSVMMAFTFEGTTFSRMWDIKVTQIECSNGGAPPTTCLQYLTGLTGRITTFNWAGNENHLNDQDYNVCIRAECGMCCVKYQLCSDVDEAVAMSLDVAMATSGVDDDCLTQDHVIIPESEAECLGHSRSVNSRYCGSNLNWVTALTENHGICDCTAPFTVGIHTNANADGAATNTATTNTNTAQNRGLCLEYTQQPC